jgi:hypothetical protein
MVQQLELLLLPPPPPPVVCVLLQIGSVILTPTAYMHMGRPKNSLLSHSGGHSGAAFTTTGLCAYRAWNL